MRRMIWPMFLLGALLFTLGTGSASANWGLYNTCGERAEGSVNEHCYALAEDNIETYATSLCRKRASRACLTAKAGS